MNVFVNEPSIDWLVCAFVFSFNQTIAEAFPLQQQAKQQLMKAESSGDVPSPSSSSPLLDYAPKKLEVAMRKLDGDNPAAIME